MSVLKGDYIGFSYNGVHSSDLGIIRISDGSRFNENLLPTLQDKTVQIPGGDGTYYFGSYYTQRQFEISFAFDSLTEQQLDFMKELFGDKKIHPLIFDEMPYKIYQAKVTGTNSIKYVPFSEGEVNRVYKGEGSIQFTCYQPYAICKDKNLHNYDIEQAKEWNKGANLLDLSKDKLDTLMEDGITKIEVYNPGVKEADWELIFAFGEDGLLPGLTLSINEEQIQIGNISAKTSIKNTGPFRDTYVCFNSKTKLIEGLTDVFIDSTNNTHNYVKSGNIYNEYIMAGDFFGIPVTIKKTPSETKRIKTWFEISNNETSTIVNSSPQYYSLDYNYYYF